MLKKRKSSLGSVEAYVCACLDCPATCPVNAQNKPTYGYFATDGYDSRIKNTA